MQNRKVTVGYRSVQALQPSPILPVGAQIMGHEFHYSELASAVPTATAAYQVAERNGATEGFAAGNVLASYVHLHFGSDPAMAHRLVEACAKVTPL
jgi:cobyrinic acid a,c-diamide synthase